MPCHKDFSPGALVTRGKKLVAGCWCSCDAQRAGSKGAALSRLPQTPLLADSHFKERGFSCAGGAMESFIQPKTALTVRLAGFSTGLGKKMLHILLLLASSIVDPQP